MSDATAALRVDREPVTELPDVIHLPDLTERTKKVRSGSGRRQRKTGVFVRLLPDEFSRLTAEAAAAGVSIPTYLGPVRKQLLSLMRGRA